MSKVLIIGASSAMAESTARLLAQRGDELFLLGRDSGRLAAQCADLKVLGASAAGYGLLDVDRIEDHGPALEQACAALGRLDVALIAHGTLPDQKACEQDAGALLAALQTNAIGTVALLSRLGNLLERQRGGTLVVIGSVAGDRGRPSNYVYGSAKAMVDAFASGLRNRLQRSGARVCTIKPGFVDTPMTADFDKGLLWAQPDRVARGIVRAIDHGRPVSYLPWFWRGIMLIIRHIPERIFMRLSL